ncbi:helix-turn-helix domain-containing protein [Thioalkalivibrio sp.]|uniref:helix-turn-helix domain-containing protein n=1 Tax=Thioalkalivibrio sp. TaxID=2093813 RepID=UPI0039752571
MRYHFTACPETSVQGASLAVAGHSSPSRAVGCGACRLASQCLPLALKGAGNETLERLVQQTPLLEKGRMLHQRGAPFENLYVVQVGALKGIIEDTDGSEAIARFYLPGEIVGLHAISRGRVGLNIVALETSALCRIPYDVLQHHAGSSPALMHWLLCRISAEILAEQETRMAFTSGNAAQVLARALIDLGRRFAAAGLSPTRLRLPMNRCELGSYLGLTPETMSRLFQRFMRQGLIAAVRREIELLDTDGLRRLAERRAARIPAPHPEPAYAAGQA